MEKNTNDHPQEDIVAMDGQLLPETDENAAEHIIEQLREKHGMSKNSPLESTMHV